MNDLSPKYGPVTATAMIVGVCIGSGIFFKTDNILAATGGSISLGVLLFVLSALSIVFGCLTFGELATVTERTGGLISYAECCIGKDAACGYGWFQLLVYYPALISMVSWVCGVYICILFALPALLLVQLGIGYAFLTLCFLYNIFAPRLGAMIQNATTLIKLIPLTVLGVCGILLGNPSTASAMKAMPPVEGTFALSALAPIAFAFDGWIVATSISHEVRDARRTMPRVLTVAPLIVLSAYILYFVGTACYLGPDTVVALGDRHVSVAAERFLGSWFSKVMVAFVVVSVMGAVNGMVTGYIRLPYALARRQGMIPLRRRLAVLNRSGMPVHAALAAFLICTVWTLIHAACTHRALLASGDVSEGAVVMSYLLYMVLYIRVICLWRHGTIRGIFRGMVFPALAILGSLTILFGGMQDPANLILFFCSLLIFFSGILYSRYIPIYHRRSL